jgi:hypothetical protein
MFRKSQIKNKLEGSVIMKIAVEVSIYPLHQNKLSPPIILTH